MLAMLDECIDPESVVYDSMSCHWYRHRIAVQEFKETVKTEILRLKDKFVGRF
jgi:hypothetical protein